MADVYIVNEDLYWPADPAVIARIAGGERVLHEERGLLMHARAGEERDDLPALSVPWLLEQGRITRKQAPVAAVTTRQGGMRNGDTR